MVQALVLGRFQPVHIGHESLLKDAARRFDLVMVGICTREKDSDNPLSFAVRKKMIENILKDAKIYEIPDINDPPNYEKHVRKIVTEFDKDTVIISGNRYTVDCFKGHKAEAPKKILDVCSSAVRDAIRSGEDWHPFVPRCNWKIFDEKMFMKERQVKTEEIYEGSYVRLEKKTFMLRGMKAIREIVSVPSAVAVLPVIGDKVLLVRQFRPAVGKETLEIPAGLIDEGESAMESAKRELAEETGASGDLKEICSYNPSLGFCNYKMTLFYAKIRLVGKIDDKDVTGVVRMPVEEAYSMVLDGKIIDAKSQIAIRHYYNEVWNENSSSV